MGQPTEHGDRDGHLKSPYETPRIIGSPFRNFLGLRKTSSPGSSLHSHSSEPQSSRLSLQSSSEPQSLRASNASASEVDVLGLVSLKHNLGTVSIEKNHRPNVSVEISTSSFSSNWHLARREGQSLVMIAFHSNVREISHAGIVWAMEHTLRRGDILAIVSVVNSIRGPLGLPVKVGDQKWLRANQKHVEEEIRRKMTMWKEFPGLENRCQEGGVKLVVIVKAAGRPELAICKEAIKLGATHVVLDRSLKNRRREYYLQNLSCCVTRMRRSGGVDVLRSSAEPSSPTSVIPVPLLSYGGQIDLFGITLGTKRLSTPPMTPSVSSTTSSHRSSSVSHGVRSSFTLIDDEIDDDLFSIYHGSTRHTELDIELLNMQKPCASEYESDERPGIGNPSFGFSNSNPPIPTAISDPLTQATISRITFVVGLGQSVELNLHSALRPGEGLLVGSLASALFLLQRNAISPNTLSVGTLGSYIAMEGGMAMKLAYLESDQRVLAVDTSGRSRTIPVGHGITHAKPLVLVEAQSRGRRHSVMLHHSQSVCLSAHGRGGDDVVILSVKSLKVGDKVLLRLRSDAPSHAIWY